MTRRRRPATAREDCESVVQAFGEAAAHVRVGSEVIDRVSAFGRLSTEPDPARRRALFDALEPVWRGASWLPTLAEIKEPEEWLDRVRLSDELVG